MKAARIALFQQTLDAGGAQKIMVNLARGFAERGHDVDFVLSEASGPLLAEIPEPVRIVSLGAGRLRRSVLPLARYLRRERPAALFSALDYVNVIALWARRLAGGSTRVIACVHTTVSVDRANEPRSPLDVLPWLMRCTYPRAAEVVAVSTGAADDLAHTARLPRDRIRVIYNPVVTPEFASRARASLDDDWFAAGAPPVILSVGRLTRAKDYPTLLRAFERVRRQRRARLLLLGEGEERASLEALARDLSLGEDVRMPGFAANPYPYMSRAAVFVLSSAWEALPTALIEALACGTRVVSTDCPSGPREILQDGRYGALVETRDEAALAGAILAALDAPDDADRLRARADEFSVERILPLYERLIEA
ncbi:MAG: glycosyltransferase [Deltaproteobacteria bacterium]|nr:MAG: glycosyltransferase [Deltaproteobacteria bacterium]